MRTRIAFSLALAILASSTAALADAAALKQAGDEAYDAHRFEEAARAYESAWEEKADPTVLYNLARTYDALGRNAEALDRLERFAETAPPEVRKKVPRLDGMLQVYRTRVATIEVRANVGGARVVVSGARVGETGERPTRFRVNAGHASLVVTKDGYRPWSTETTLQGETTTVVVAKLEADEAPPTRVREESRPFYTSPWFFVGIGAVVVTVTSVVLYVALTTEMTPDPGTLGTVPAPLVTF